MNIPYLIAALEEAVSDNRMAFLCQKFGVDAEFVVELSQADPTNGKYVAWLLLLAKDRKLMDYGVGPKFTLGPRLGRIYSILSEFVRLSRKPAWKGEKDLMRYPDLGAVVAANTANYGLETKKEINRRLSASGLVFMAEEGDLTLFRIGTSQAADAHLRDAPVGPQGPWCIKDNSHFEKYTPPFYYIRQRVGDAGDWQHYKLLHLPGEHKGYECRDAEARDTSPVEFLRMGVSLDPLWEGCIETKEGESSSIHVVSHMLRQQPELIPFAVAYWVKRNAAVALTNITQTIASTKFAADHDSVVTAASMLPPEALEVISRNGAMACVLYRWGFMPQERWPEAEPAILEWPEHIPTYWSAANPKPAPRWPEGEAAIMASEEVAPYAKYALLVLKQAWPEVESRMVGMAVTDEVPPDENREPWRYSPHHNMREIAAYSAAYHAADGWPELSAAIASAPWPQETREYWLTKSKLA